MIDFEKTTEVPIRLIFRGDSTPDYVKSVSFMEDERILVYTDEGRAIDLLEFITGKVNCYDHRLKYAQILDTYRKLPGAIPSDWKFVKRVTSR